MNIGEKLSNNFPNSINKGAPIFSAMIANSNKTGAIETALNDANKYATEYRNSKNIYSQSDSLLDKTASFFTFLERYSDESDSNFKKRLKTIFYRNGLKTWGNVFDVKSMFTIYFPNADIYLIENTGDIDTENYIQDFDFEDQNEDEVWSLQNCVLNHSARFSRGYGCELKSNSKLSQEIEIESGTYYLHFFSKGKCSIQIKNSAGKYWKPNLEFDPDEDEWTVGEWTSSVFSIIADNENWNDNSILYTANTDDTITINFIGTEKCYVDYVRVFKYKNYPTFTLLAYFIGETSDKATALAPGSDDEESDPLEKYAYQTDSQHDYSYLTGAQNSGFGIDYHKEILAYAKASGVKAYIEIVNKDEEEDTNV